MSSLRRSLLAFLLALGTISCGSDSTGPTTTSMTGTWAGRASKNGVSIAVRIQLVAE